VKFAVSRNSASLILRSTTCGKYSGGMPSHGLWSWAGQGFRRCRRYMFFFKELSAGSISSSIVGNPPVMSTTYFRGVVTLAGQKSPSDALLIRPGFQQLLARAGDVGGVVIAVHQLEDTLCNGLFHLVPEAGHILIDDLMAETYVIRPDFAHLLYGL